MNNGDCPECGADGTLGRGYGEQSAFECPECGHEWVEDSPGGSYLP